MTAVSTRTTDANAVDRVPTNTGVDQPRQHLPVANRQPLDKASGSS